MTNYWAAYSKLPTLNPSTHTEEIEMSASKPKCKLIGEDGNVFNLSPLPCMVTTRVPSALHCGSAPSRPVRLRRRRGRSPGPAARSTERGS